MNIPGRKPKDTGAIVDEDGVIIGVHVGGTTVTEQLRAIYANSPAVELNAGGHLVNADEQMTPEQRKAEEDCRSFGMRYNAEQRSVSLPTPQPGQSERLFKRTEEQLTRGLGLRDSLHVLQALEQVDGRAKLAEYLAREGMLTAEELAHLKWLATAAGGADDVLPPTQPITADDARRILALVEGGVPQATTTRVIRFFG